MWTKLNRSEWFNGPGLEELGFTRDVEAANHDAPSGSPATTEPGDWVSIGKSATPTRPCAFASPPHAAIFVSVRKRTKQASPPLIASCDKAFSVTCIRLRKVFTVSVGLLFYREIGPQGGY